MTAVIGPNFANEIAAAGLSGLPFSWGPDGLNLSDARLTDAQRSAIQAVLDTHDPSRNAAAPYVPPTPREWLERLTTEKQAAIAAEARANDALFLWFMKAAGAAQIDVTLQETKDGVAALVAVGALSAADQAVLLAP